MKKSIGEGVMDNNKIEIREMKKEEQKAVVKIARKAFQFLETLFLGPPQKAMVAEYEGKIIGGIIYKYINSKNKKIAYIQEAFVDPDYHSLGVGKKLYTFTFDFLWNQGCDGITALVKDDNVASWKLFITNGFKRAGFLEIIKQLGMTGMGKQYVGTPFFAAVGMDFYMVMKEKKVKEKNKEILQMVTFLFANLLIIVPLWINLFKINPQILISCLASYTTILILFLLTRYIGTLFSKRNWKFRFNNGGSFITFLLSFLGNTFPMNGNWYPEKYENTEKFKRDLAIPEFIKWGVFILLPFLALTQNSYFRMTAQISCFYLIFITIPIYPFESLGGGRIYGYSKKLWLVTAVITLAELVLILLLFTGD